MAMASEELEEVRLLELSYLSTVCRDSLYEFVKEFWTLIESQPYIDNWHIGAICEHLEAVTRGQIERLLINIPPGCSKSLITSVFWPCWEWARDPSVRWFFASYDQKLSTRDSVKCRALISSPVYQELWGHSFNLTYDQNQKTYYETSKGGWRLATTPNGHGTGEHPDRIIFDDIHNVQQAESEVERQSVIDWNDLTMTTRGVSRRARRVCIMQRLHERDMSAHLLAQGGWEHICLCMRHEVGRMQPTSLGWTDPRQEEGELLTPQQFDDGQVSQMERTLGPYGTAGQLQQRPKPRGGGMFKPTYFTQVVRAAPLECTRIRYWDRAACLVSGVEVETVSGPVVIESIREGDLVLTREGFKRVKWAGVSGVVNKLVSVIFSNGSVVTGTHDHSVWLENRGWCEIESVRGSDYARGIYPEDSLWSRNEKSSRFCSTAFFIRGTRGIGTIRGGLQTPVPASALATPSTGPSGGGSTEPFPLATISTTKTATGITTRLVIWSASRGETTTEFTIPSEGGTIPPSLRFIRRRFAGCGCDPLFIENTVASNVRRLSNPVIWTPFVSNTAPPSVGTGTGWGSRRGRVPSVGRSTMGRTGPTAALRSAHNLGYERCASSAASGSSPRPRLLSSALGVVGRNLPGSIGVPVYDLQVEDCHEFYADGILVHNTADGGCYTAGVLEGLDKEGKYYVENVVKGQWEPDERNNTILATAQRDRMKYGPSHEPLIVIEAERGSTGLESFRNIKRKLKGFRVREDMPSGSKDVRAEPWADELAAQNVWLVVDGTWDAGNYIQEHLSFRPEPGKRLGKWKDQVDASSGAYNLLSGRKQAGVGVMRILRSSPKDNTVKVVVLDEDYLSHFVADEKALLVRVTDPDPLGSPEVPATGLSNLLDTHTLRFVSQDPKDLQECWEEILDPYGKPPKDLVMSQEQGKKLWSFLLRTRSQGAPKLYVFLGDEDRSLSLATSFCDVMRLPRESSIYFPAAETRKATKDEQPPIDHVYQVVKRTRCLVM